MTAAPDGSGNVQVIRDFYHLPVIGTAKRMALAATLRLISVARKWVFEEYLKEGGSIEELREG